MTYDELDPQGVLNADERRSAEKIIEFAQLGDSQAGHVDDFSTPLMEISSTVMPLSIVFDCVAYLNSGHTNIEMFDMIQRLKAAFE